MGEGSMMPSFVKAVDRVRPWMRTVLPFVSFVVVTLAGCSVGVMPPPQAPETRAEFSLDRVLDAYSLMLVNRSDRSYNLMYLRAMLPGDTPEVSAKRIAFMEALLKGRRLFVRVKTDFKKPLPNVPGSFVEVVYSPGEVYLADGRALTVLLMERGMTSFDPHWPWLTTAERSDYERAQAHAQQLRLGLWRDS